MIKNEVGIFRSNELLHQTFLSIVLSLIILFRNVLFYNQHEDKQQSTKVWRWIDREFAS